MSDTDDDGFLLYNPGVIELLKDRDFFARAIAQFYALTAGQHGCSITLSDRRLKEAHAAWTHDCNHALQSETDKDTIALDHFKHSAFIAFWLRRSIPINDIFFVAEKKAEGGVPSVAQRRFAQYGNEIAALYAGFTVCLAYETAAMLEREEGEDGKPHIISDAIGVQSFPPYLQNEYPRILKHKSMSPHGMYMLFRSLFYQMQWAVKGRERAA